MTGGESRSFARANTPQGIQRLLNGVREQRDHTLVAQYQIGLHALTWADFVLPAIAFKELLIESDVGGEARLR